MMTFRPGQRLVIPGVQVLSPRPSSAAGVLDGISNIAVAYSLRKLRSAYAGSAVRVRRSSDSTEQDIGFASDGEFDSSAFSSFVSGGTGYVKTWYDQSGNSRDATQTTTGSQPSISLSAVNSKPALLWDGSNDQMSFTKPTDSNVTFVSPAIIANPGDFEEVFMGNSSVNATIVYLGYDDDAQGMRVLVSTGGYFGGLKRLNVRGSAQIFSLVATGTSARHYLNGSAQGSAITIGGNFNPSSIASYHNGTSYLRNCGMNCPEIVLLSSVSVSDHNTIGTDMATRYGLSWTTVT